MVVATVVMWGMIWWWCGSDLMGLNASRSWLFCIGGASATILMGLGGVVDGSDGTVGCWWVLVVGLLNGSQWCFSAEVGGSAHGSHSGFGFVILVGCFSFSFSGCWWWWGCGFGFVILVGCFSFSTCWWWWGCRFRSCDFGGWELWWLPWLWFAWIEKQVVGFFRDTDKNRERKKYSERIKIIIFKWSCKKSRTFDV